MPPRKGSTKELKCSHCDYSTHRKPFMDDHMRIHTGDRPYKCNECGKGFTQKSNLTKHMIVHGSGYKTEYKCDRCDFTTRYKQSLKMHQNWHSGVKPYGCNICGRSFSQSTHRRTHMKEAHDDERKYICHLCSKCFKRKEHLDKHIAFHKNERNYACDVCGKTFIEEKHVSLHKLIHGGDETKVHQCDLCPYKSRYKQGLQVHYRIHLGVRPYTCQQCPKAFRTSQTLRIHTRMVHQGLMGKIFHCDMCDYRTANKQTLKSHLESIHMGIKKKSEKYPCPYCGNIYLGHSSLHGHKRKKHPQKLKHEMQLRLQQRLAMIRSPEGKLHAKVKANTDHAMQDYRFRNPVHSSLRDKLVIKLDSNSNDKEGEEGGGMVVNTEDGKSTTKKGKNKAKNNTRGKKGKKVEEVATSPIKDSIKIKQSSSEKKKKAKQTSEKKSKASESVKKNTTKDGNKSTIKESPREVKSTKRVKKPVHDLIQERLAKKQELASAKKSTACKKIDFSPDNTSVIENTSVSSDNLNKESYMSNLGLLHRANPTSSSTDKITNGSNESRDASASCNGQAPVIVIQPLALGVITTNTAHSRSQQISPTAKQKSPPKVIRSFPQIKPLNLSVGKKDSSKKKPGAKSPRPKNNKTNNSPQKVPKGRKQVPKGKAGQSDDQSSSLIVYEPEDEPSLGPYTRVEERSSASMVDISPTAGSMLEVVPEIKQEEEYMPIPLNYSMNEFDSLRALASVYLEKSSA